MIPCPHCDRQVPKPESETIFECSFCNRIIDLDGGGLSRKAKIAIGVGIAVAATVGAVKLFGDTVEPKFSPAYGAAVEQDVKF